MAAPASLTQLARTLGQSPAWVRHHILALESANLIELAEVPEALRWGMTAFTDIEVKEISKDVELVGHGR